MRQNVKCGHNELTRIESTIHSAIANTQSKYIKFLHICMNSYGTCINCAIVHLASVQVNASFTLFYRQRCHFGSFECHIRGNERSFSFFSPSLAPSIQDQLHVIIMNWRRILRKSNRKYPKALRYPTH